MAGGTRGAQTKEELLLWDLKQLLTTISGGGGGGGLATESTLQSVLNSIVASQDIEILLVRDTGNADLVVQQIREYDQGTGLWSTRYEKVDGSPYVAPELVGPLEYLDPSAVLNSVLAELITLNATDFATETTLANILLDTTSIDGKVATEVTLAALLVAFNAEDFASQTTLQALLTAFNSEDFATQTTLQALLTAFNAEDFATETTLSALAATDFATETTLSAVSVDVSTLATPVTNLAMNMFRTSASGTVGVGKRRISVFNAGNSDGVVLTSTIKKGESMTFSADGLRDTLGLFSYDGTGTELVITTIG